MKDFGIGNSKFGMEIHENFIPHDALCSTGESLYYNFDYDTNQGIVVFIKIHAHNICDRYWKTRTDSFNKTRKL